MRVAGGTVGGIPLCVPRSAGETLRPTMERVKNAIFNVLAESIEGTRVLDLFAGIGGLGIEALSRGAGSCTFIENDRRACDAIRANLDKTRLTGGEVVSADALGWLDRTAPVGAFHIIFADPPYVKKPGDRDFTAELIASAAVRRALKPGGLFIIEHLPGKPLELAGRWECARDKRYGATAVAFLRPAPDARLADADAAPTQPR